jgi:uncharacterized membrane protein SpoIIM required for sporulation
MTVRAFTIERKPRWDELRQLVDGAGRHPEKLPGDRVRRLGLLYRATAADLAQARMRFPGDPVVAELEQLVARSRAITYSAATRRESFRQFATTGYWQLVAAQRLALAVSALLLFGPWVLAGMWALDDPEAASGLVPAEYRSVTEPRSTTDLGLSTDEMAAFSSEIFTNNIQVTLVAFAGGVLLGVGTAFILVFNGAFLGVVSGLAIGSGNGQTFAELVLAHGVLELSCIVVAGAAGLRLGWAIVEPGPSTRRASAARAARSSVLVALGTAPWLVVAGLVEGFVTPAGYGATAVLAVGFGLGALYWGLVVWRGSADQAPVTEEPWPLRPGTT